MGFPISLLPRWLSGEGSPDSEADRSGHNFSLLRHPIAWVRWRIALRRRGPYTPDFKEFRQKPQPDTE